MSIQSNLQAHEKSTLDNRQFLCSAASRGMTCLAKVGKEEVGRQRRGRRGGDLGPVVVITAHCALRRDGRGLTKSGAVMGQGGDPGQVIVIVMCGGGKKIVMSVMVGLQKINQGGGSLKALKYAELTMTRREEEIIIQATEKQGHSRFTKQGSLWRRRDGPRCCCC